MKRASEVPPVVDSSGLRPATSRQASLTASTKGPGSVRKASPETLICSASLPANPAWAAAHSASS